jgi:hypothetical protein
MPTEVSFPERMDPTLSESVFITAKRSDWPERIEDVRVKDHLSLSSNEAFMNALGRSGKCSIIKVNYFS